MRQARRLAAQRLLGSSFVVERIEPLGVTMVGTRKLPAERDRIADDETLRSACHSRRLAGRPANPSRSSSEIPAEWSRIPAELDMSIDLWNIPTRKDRRFLSLDPEALMPLWRLDAIRFGL